MKLRQDGKNIYYLASGTNRVFPLDVVEKKGRRFTSLDSLLEFTKSKPEDAMLFQATSETVRDDSGRLQALSSLERRRIWGEKEGENHSR